MIDEIEYQVATNLGIDKDELRRLVLLDTIDKMYGTCTNCKFVGRTAYIEKCLKCSRSYNDYYECWDVTNDKDNE